MRLFPLNSVTSAPPGKGLTTRDLNLGSDGSESDSNSSSSDSSSDSDSDSESEAETKKSVKPRAQPMKVELKPRKKVDDVKPFATCKHCGGKKEVVCVLITDDFHCRKYEPKQAGRARDVAPLQQVRPFLSPNLHRPQPRPHPREYQDVVQMRLLIVSFSVRHQLRVGVHGLQEVYEV